MDKKLYVIEDIAPCSEHYYRRHAFLGRVVELVKDYEIVPSVAGELYQNHIAADLRVHGPYSTRPGSSDTMCIYGVKLRPIKRRIIAMPKVGDYIYVLCEEDPPEASCVDCALLWRGCGGLGKRMKNTCYGDCLDGYDYYVETTYPAEFPS